MRRLIIFFLFCALATAGFAQIDTSSYPVQRREVLDLLRRGGPAKEKSCGDLIAVGPKGDISFSRKEWVEVQAREKLVFKSFRIVPGTEIVRVYDSTCAVVNFVAEVGLTVAGKDISLKVRRLEVYHKNAGGWCMVAGQGTEVDEKMFPVKEY
ncbi:MAG: nuclear transport factor 2 family protein [Chitinophagaceae bacterium]|nr:nuclear transport factor 2 family protein [Chitinophagaceae bacterium]